MIVQSFLRNGGTLDDLMAKYAIKSTRSIKHNNLVLLKYNQIDSPFAEQIVQECRGLILDEADDWRVISRSYIKFFNHGEGHSAEIDWNTARVQEKADGSLTCLFHYNDQWHVQTSGHPDAAGKVNDQDFTFSDLFWKTWQELNYGPVDGLNKDLCYSFELMTKHNRVVVQHQKPRLVLIGIRNRVTGQEMHVNDCVIDDWEVVREFPLQSIADITKTFQTMEPLKQEGYVVVDANFNRVKVKHPGYVAIHHLKEGHSTRRLVEIVQAGEVGEFLSYFPEWRDEFEEIQNGMEKLEAELIAAYDAIKDIAIQKDFALEALKTRCSAALFLLRTGKVESIGEYLRKIQADKIIQMLGLKEKKVETE